jgi:uncharacterized protein YdeI (YjbR/CyaY-like superfamily)
MHKIDDEKYAQRYSPRRKGANWSEINKTRVAKLIREGRMTAAGLAKVDFPLEGVSPERPKPESRPEPPMPPAFQQALREHPLALENFQNMAPSYRRQYLGWIGAARREETLARRVEEAIQLLLRNEKLGMK